MKAKKFESEPIVAVLCVTWIALWSLVSQPKSVVMVFQSNLILIEIVKSANLISHLRARSRSRYRGWPSGFVMHSWVPRWESSMLYVYSAGHPALRAMLPSITIAWTSCCVGLRLTGATTSCIWRIRQGSTKRIYILNIIPCFCSRLDVQVNSFSLDGQTDILRQ